VLFQKNVFFFNIKEAYLIEKGRLTAPLGNIMVQGNIVEVLNSIEMVANDFHYDTGNSYCFKNGQVLNVRVGQPTIKMNNLVISRGE
jgi:TldD protein